MIIARDSGNIVEILVAASGGIVQPAVPMLLDDDGGLASSRLPYVAVHKGQIQIDTNTLTSYSLLDAAMQQTTYIMEVAHAGNGKIDSFSGTVICFSTLQLGPTGRREFLCNAKDPHGSRHAAECKRHALRAATTV